MTLLECLPALTQSGVFDHVFSLLAAADPAGAGDALHAADDPGPEPGEMIALLRWTVTLGFFTLSVGILLCLVRLWRGPSLADRVLASDTLALHVVALVVLLTIYLGDLTFFDAVLGVSIIGFAGTVGFAQYIGAQGREDNEPPAAAEVSS